MNPQSKQGTAAAEQVFLQILREQQRFLLTGHMNPDGDCIGAQAALYRILRALGREVFIVNPDPPEARYDYLSQEVPYTSYSAGEELPDHDVSILLDCSELSRVGEMGERLGGLSTTKLVIDHHVHRGEHWWDAAFVDQSASATGLLIFRLARALDVELDPVAASGIFTSLVTDTGWFKYSNTDGETLSVAGELVGQGLDPSLIYQAIYQRQSSRHPLNIGRILTRAVYHAGGKLAVIALPHSETPKGLDGDDALDLLRAVGEVEVVLFLREVEAGRCKLSARSKSDDHDVAQLAAGFGGGGHRRAAGATIEGELEANMQRLVSAARIQFGWGEEAGEGGLG